MSAGLILKRDHLGPLLRKLCKDRRLVAPVKNEYGDTLYSEIEDLENTVIDLENQPQNSLKSFFLPQREKLSSYTIDRDLFRGGTEYNFYPHLLESRPTIYFGVRSCDLFAVLYSDVLFLRNSSRDIYYEKKREGAIFITIACNNPFEKCFCNATRSGPYLELGFDLQLFELGDRFFVETGKAQGVKLTRTWSQYFTQATEGDRRAQFQLALEARGLFKRHVHVDLAVQLLANADEPVDDVISDLSGKCQDCGGCAYICPTCTCFNIIDYQLNKDSGERIRSWDACTFAGFTRMAGDHNPVDVEKQRIRKRFLHKLKHDVEKHGRPSCVGCGRCVGICFGGVDIVSFIDAISKTIDQKGGPDD